MSRSISSSQQSRSGGSYHQRPRHDKRNEHTAPQQEQVLFPGSVAKVFHDILRKNSNAKTYDSLFYKLQSIMKCTFKSPKEVNRNDVFMFNEYGTEPGEEPIIIKPNSFDAEKWVSLYVQSIPDLKLPAYTVEWSVPFLWVFDNIQTSIDGIDRTKWIAQTRTRDEEGELLRSHEDYETSCAIRKEQRAKILAMLTDIIKNNHERVCVSTEEPLEIPTFSGPDSVYTFYALRLTWLLITMHGNHINFGKELNMFAYVINISRQHAFDEYITRMKHLRTDKSIREKYGTELCDLLAKLIEETFTFHHSNGIGKNNIPMYVKNMIQHIINYLDVHGKVIPKRHVFGNPLQITLKLLKNRYSGTLKREVTAILQTYPKEALEAYLLDTFVGNGCLTQHMYDSFLLMHKLYDTDVIERAIRGGFCGRNNDIKVHQLAYAVIFGIMNPIDCLADDSFLPPDLRIDSLIIMFEASPVNKTRAIYEQTKDILRSISDRITKRQAFKLIDCFQKIGIQCPSFIVEKKSADA